MTQEENKAAVQENNREPRTDPPTELPITSDEVSRRLRALERQQRAANVERDPDLMLELTQAEPVPGSPSIFSLRFTRGDGCSFAFQIDHVQCHALSDRLLTLAIKLAAEKEGASR